MSQKKKASTLAKEDIGMSEIRLVILRSTHYNGMQKREPSQPLASPFSGLTTKI